MILYNTYMGRLGNKMFIYACAYSVYKKRNFLYVLDEPILFKYFKLSIQDRFFNWLKLKYFWWITHKLFFKGTMDMMDCNKIYSENEFIDNSISTGYFQSHCYFEEYKTQIVNRFRIQEVFKKHYQSIATKLNQNLSNIVIHVRRTDYLKHQPNNIEIIGCVLPMEYYQKILALETKELQNVIFISDDITYCKTHFSHIKNAYFSENEPIIDLQFMMNASICVISNSTFSWWGAYLNTKKSKVYAPKYFLGAHNKTEYPINIYPKEWIQIEI